MKMLKNIQCKLVVVAVALLGCMSPVQAQQDAQYSQYMFNQLAYNPAYAGSRDALSATMVLRKQWLGFDGSPTTGNINVHAPIANERHGLGFNFEHDRIGVTSQSNLAFSYAYRIPVSKGFLSLGLDAGLLQYKTRFSQINPSDVDPSKPTVDAAAMLPRAGAGAYFSTPKFYAGLSVPNLLAGRYFGSGNQTAGQLASKQSMHMFGMIGGILPMGSNVSFRPSAVLKYVPNAPMQVDLNATMFFAKVIGVGVGYRTTDALVFMLEFQSTRRFRAGYSYDMTLSQLRTYNSGSHELMIGLDLGWGKANFMTPRYF
jgi:type IX secretion system PorP/SprF family membrane protein